MHDVIAVDRVNNLRRALASSSRWLSLGSKSLVAIKITAVFLILFLASYNLEYYPTTWFDEGSHLHVPKALIQHGVYADTSSEGFRYFGPTTGVGPTVMLPIALSFKVAGIGLTQARTVMVAYLLAGMLLFFLAARRIYGSATAWLALMLLVSSPAINVLYFGRQVLGEVPALAFLMLGFMLWWRGTDHRASPGWILWAGLAFGLAALTKSQYALVLAPTFLVLLALDRFYYRQLSAASFAVPLAVTLAAVGVGYVVQVLPVLGDRDLSRALALWKDATSGAIFVFSPSRMLSSLKFLSGGDALGYWALPALAYGLVLARERSASGVRQALLLAFALVGMAWYSVGSIGWVRYAFPSLAVATIFAARLFSELIFDQRMASRLGLTASRGTSLALLLGLVFIIGHPLIASARETVSAFDRGPQLTAAYLDANVPATAVIETWEPELGFLTDHNYHYPPLGWLDRSVRAKWLTPSEPLEAYDPATEAHPSYLIVGHFAKYTGIYSYVLSHEDARPLISIGGYDIYRLE